MRGRVNAETGNPGLYVHVPFCAKTCDFCAFYQTEPTASAVARYLDGIEREIGLLGWNRPVDTVFWGGGTPGLLSPAAIRRLGALIGPLGRESGVQAREPDNPLRLDRAIDPGRSTPDRSGPREWTVELAPGSVTAERLEALREIGVTRVSLGVQSFRPELLEAIGRPHTLPQIERAYALVRAAGFASVNLDLMFALPGQTEEARAADVHRAVALGPDHLSTYCLTFEEDTALWMKLSQGRVKLDRENEARHYEATWAQLAAAGYAQYEVSNFARPGHECRHNLATWAMGEWIGLGPSAASQHAGARGANVADLDQWCEAVGRGIRADRDRVELTPALLAEDALIFGLRLNAGVALAQWREAAPTAPWNEVDALLARLEEEALARREADRVWLTPKGRLVADAIGAEIMEAFAAPSAAKGGVGCGV